MLLSVTDRILLMGLLPEKGNIVTLRVVRDARQALDLTPEEIAAWEVTHDGPMLRWNREKAQDVDVPLSSAALGIAREQIKKLDSEQKLEAVHIPLWEKLIEAVA